MAYKKQDSEKIEGITEIEEKLNEIKNLIIEMDKKFPKDEVEKQNDDLVNKKTTIENEIKKYEEEIKKCIDVINNDEEIKNIEKQISELEKSINDKKNSIEYYEKLKGKLKDINNLFKIIIMLKRVDDNLEKAIKGIEPIEKDKIEDEAKKLKLDLNEKDILTKIEDEAKKLKLDLNEKDILKIWNFFEEKYRKKDSYYNNSKVILDIEKMLKDYNGKVVLNIEYEEEKGEIKIWEGEGSNESVSNNFNKYKIDEEKFKGIFNHIKELYSKISKINKWIESLSENLVYKLEINDYRYILKFEVSMEDPNEIKSEIVENYYFSAGYYNDTKYSNLIEFLKENKLEGVLAKASNNNKKEQLILNENSINIIDEKIGEVDNIIKELNNSYNSILNIKDTNKEILNEIKNNKINSDEKIKNLNKSIEDKENELKVIDSKIDEFEKILDYSDNKTVNKIVSSSKFNRTLFSSAFNKIIKKADNSNIIKSNIKSNDVKRLKEIIKKLEEFKNKDFDPNEIKKELDYLVSEHGEFLIKVVGNLPNKEYINEEEILKKEKGPIENIQR